MARFIESIIVAIVVSFAMVQLNLLYIRFSNYSRRMFSLDSNAAQTVWLKLLRRSPTAVSNCIRKNSTSSRTSPLDTGRDDSICTVL